MCCLNMYFYIFIFYMVYWHDFAYKYITIFYYVFYINIINILNRYNKYISYSNIFITETNLLVYYNM